MAKAARLTCVLALVSAAGASAPAAKKVAATQPEVKFRVMETPYSLAENAVDPLVKETSKYVAIVRADDRGLGGLRPNLSHRLAEFVDKTPREVLADDVVRAFLKTQLGRTIIRHVEPLGRGVPRAARSSDMRGTRVPGGVRSPVGRTGAPSYSTRMGGARRGLYPMSL